MLDDEDQVVIIKPITNFQEIKQVARVEAETWGMEAGNTVPDHILKAIASEGGVLLGAYDDQRLIGFTLGWLGTIDKDNPQPAASQLKLLSHMTGVLKGYRDRRVGFKLKLAQRDWAIEQGLDLVTWTYDPLESRNGYFNIHLLGCVCDQYFSNYYGEMSDQMNQGLPSDRFRVDWWIKSHSVRSALSPKNEFAGSVKEVPEGVSSPVLSRADDSTGFILPAKRIEYLESPRIFVEIPSNFQEIRQADQDLALSWRLYTRQVFEGYFERGYQIVDFVYKKPPDPRSWYVMELKT